MITITDQISIAESEVQLEFTRASGPGGQNINKVSSAVLLRFDTNSPCLPSDVHERLVKLAKNRINEDGELIIQASRHRSQEHNRQDALERLVALIREAAEEPKARAKTKPSPASKEIRLKYKKQRGEIKKQRLKVPHPED
ncbi:MAG: alternative ribosome rescue aminoacyl-tRNA hydrolase ArfB [Anaerolineales bacterium]